MEFRVPLAAHVERTQDIDYVVYSIPYGSKKDKVWLSFMVGALVGGLSPKDLGDSAIQWTGQVWGCNQEELVKDWRGVTANGRRSRLMNIPLGIAIYQGVSTEAAQYFDKVLDTMCCRKSPSGQK